MSASARPRAPAIRVVVVDDSFVCRAVLKEMLEADRDVAVVGEATSAAEAFDVVARLRPDLVTMDVRMPGGSGLDAVTRLMREAPLPILVVTDMPTRRDDDVVFEATRRGALEVARKPATGDLAAERALRASVRLLARVKVVRHAAHDTARDKRAIVPPRPTSAIDVIGVAASAGGPMALALLLGRIPRDFPACFAVVQHLPAGFAAAFARFLGGRTDLPVTVVREVRPAVPGGILLADDGAHLVALGRDRFGPSDLAPRQGHRPAADVLFESLASHNGPRACGIVLSGIGRDGASGLFAMRSKGAVTIAECESTAAVYGMPRAAREIGGALHVLPVEAIPALLRSLTSRGAA